MKIGLSQEIVNFQWLWEPSRSFSVKKKASFSNIHPQIILSIGFFSSMWSSEVCPMSILHYMWVSKIDQGRWYLLITIRGLSIQKRNPQLLFNWQAFDQVIELQVGRYLQLKPELYPTGQQWYWQYKYQCCSGTVVLVVVYFNVKIVGLSLNFPL